MQVIEKLGLSFKDARSLNQKLDHSLPQGPEWSRREIKLTFSSGEHTEELFHRNIMQCIEALYANPMFAGSMHHSPERLYADLKKESRILRGMHTGDWWWETQVRTVILEVLFTL